MRQFDWLRSYEIVKSSVSSREKLFLVLYNAVTCHIRECAPNGLKLLESICMDKKTAYMISLKGHMFNQEHTYLPSFPCFPFSTLYLVKMGERELDTACQFFNVEKDGFSSVAFLANFFHPWNCSKKKVHQTLCLIFPLLQCFHFLCCITCMYISVS